MGFERGVWNFIDGMYLLIFPLAQLVCVIGILYLLSSSMGYAPVFKNLVRPKNVVTAGILVSLVLAGTVAIVTPDKSPGSQQQHQQLRKYHYQYY